MLLETTPSESDLLNNARKKLNVLAHSLRKTGDKLSGPDDLAGSSFLSSLHTLSSSTNIKTYVMQGMEKFPKWFSIITQNILSVYWIKILIK